MKDSNATCFRKFAWTLFKLKLFFINDLHAGDQDFKFVDRYWDEPS